METRTCINVRNVPNGLPDEETEGDTPATHHALVWGFCASVVLAMLLPSLFRNQASLYSTAVFNASVSVDWQGFGTSLAWWAEFVGTLDSDSRRQLLVQIFDQESNDSLKFNIVRYNLGGAPYMLMENGTTPGTSFGAYKGIPSPRLPNGSFVWDVELPQVRVAQDCASLGVNVVEAFVNSREFSCVYLLDLKAHELSSALDDKKRHING